MSKANGLDAWMDLLATDLIDPDDIFKYRPMFKALISAEVNKARIDEADLILDKMYDINSVEWGVPTKWSKEKYGKENYADLFVPTEAVREMILNRLSELKEQTNVKN